MSLIWILLPYIYSKFAMSGLTLSVYYLILRLTALFWELERIWVVYCLSCLWKIFNHLEMPVAAFRAIQQWEFGDMQQLLWHVTSVWKVISENLSLLLQRCFHDLGLSWLRFKHLTFRMRVKRSNKLRRRMIWPKWQHPIGNLIKSLLPRLG